MWRVLFWTLLAWPLPAVVAGAAGWQGVWGSGSALFDYLIPLPVAGGALHVPTFLAAAVALFLAPRLRAPEMQRVRALALGLGIAGGLMLFEGPGGRVQQNPLGLFLLSDGLLASLAFGLFRQRPWLRLEPLSLGLLLAPAALLAVAVWRLSPASRDFNTGQTTPDASNTEVTVFVHTTLKPDSTRFRAAAEAWAAAHQHPTQWFNTEDAALHFVPTLQAAIAGERGAVFATLCQYEDGTPPRWLPGLGDCFSGHETFAEKVRQAVAAQPAGLAPEVREHFALQATCDRAPPPPPGPPSNAISRVWLCMNLSAARASLAKRFPRQLP